MANTQNLGRELNSANLRTSTRNVMPRIRVGHLCPLPVPLRWSKRAVNYHLVRDRTPLSLCVC